MQCCDLAAENKACAGRAGGIDAMVAAMMAHVGDADLLGKACIIISSICDDNGVYTVHFELKVF